MAILLSPSRHASTSASAPDDDAMYRPDPIFDVPEFPTLRRVKPLPKRRRTYNPGPPPLGPNPTTEEIIAHADSLSASMASYYLPLLQDNIPQEPPDDDEPADGDYIDHLQQPGNTKKRKVPINAFAPPQADPEDGSDGGQPPQPENDPPEREAWQGPVQQARGRATRAGLAQKEVLRARRRQLAPVLGASGHGTLALDQALGASYPFAQLGFAPDGKPANEPRMRLSRRSAPRLARALAGRPKALPAPPSAKIVALPDADFTFSYPSPAADRLVATEKEVVVLQKRFETELKRQLAKAAEAAKQAAAAMANASRPKQKGSQNRARLGITGGRGSEQSLASLEQSLLGGAGASKKKKKKRSALANASNPHHLRNYVPSRLPSSGHPANAQANAQNWLSPPPMRFLSASLPSSGKEDSAIPPLTDPTGEWICPNCEYNLFYGDDAAYRRAVRMRKKILRRKRRARERAAAAASGKSTSAARAERPPPEEELEAQFEPGYAEQVAAVQQQLKTKGERNRGEGGLEYAGNGGGGGG